ncbi:hypothetical protein LSTR_LSTR000707 [Laodelphax striatellus]|uniref:Uncharacterized protein n=1 Tax=Laodelphax striatellus TaxID=195883 RepID=A0A482XFE2_LAOST|nr:hypothetical protein LSTR_LSTR000707 [Laodelphax striatellus]
MAIISGSIWIIGLCLCLWVFLSHWLSDIDSGRLGKFNSSSITDGSGSGKCNTSSHEGRGSEPRRVSVWPVENPELRTGYWSWLLSRLWSWLWDAGHIEHLENLVSVIVHKKFCEVYINKNSITAVKRRQEDHEASLDSPRKKRFGALCFKSLCVFCGMATEEAAEEAGKI